MEQVKGVARQRVATEAGASGRNALDIALLEGDTLNSACHDLPLRFFRKFTEPTKRNPSIGAYEHGCSILIAPADFEDYWKATSSYWLRQRVRRADREGYVFESIDRNQYLDDIYAINTSLESRQGRLMSESYRTRPSSSAAVAAEGCPRHRLVYYGITRGGHLWAYAWVYQVGEMCLFSTILGHGEHLKSGIMPLLVVRTVADLMETGGLRYAMYNLHASGTDGLRFFKEQMGFQPYDVRWHLGDVGRVPLGSDPSVDALRSVLPEATHGPPHGGASGKAAGYLSRLLRFTSRRS
jgi:hypothetical protein